MFKSNPETEIEVEALAKILEGLSIDETISYEHLTATVGYSVQARPFPLMKARKQVENRTGLRFETVHGIGIKKIPASAVAGIGAAYRKRIQRTAMRQSKRLTGLRYNDIDQATQARIDAERSLLGAISATAGMDARQVEPISQTGPAVAAKVFGLLRPT